jgi:hypothetical protein
MQPCRRFHTVKATTTGCRGQSPGRPRGPLTKNYTFVYFSVHSERADACRVR